MIVCDGGEAMKFRGWQRWFYGQQEPSACERHTLPRFLCGMVFQGVWWAGYILVPFVLAKSLDASGGLITLTVMMDMGGMLLAIYWGHLLRRFDRQSITFWGGVGGRLVLVLSPAVHTAAGFAVVLAVAYFFGSLMYPAQNAILQTNFRPRLAGRVWGVGTCLQNVTAAVASILIGRLLDRDPSLFSVIYAVIGALGFVYLAILSRLSQAAPADAVPTAAAPSLSADPRARIQPAPAMGDAWPMSAKRWLLPPPLPEIGPLTVGRLWRGLLRPFLDGVQTFRRDRHYLWYEVNFTTYGLAFLAIYPILPILFRDHLGLNYEQISTARIVIASAGVAILGPVMGRMMDRYHPARLCALSFGLIALYPIGLWLSDSLTVLDPAHMIYLTFGLYALGMGGVNIAWNVGSIAFAPPGEGGHYQGIHVSMVGLRGLAGPALGFAVYKLLGMGGVFGMATLLFVLASLSSAVLARRVGGSEPVAPDLGRPAR
jgi:MFS family permease